MNSKRVVVAGASGLIGTALVQALAERGDTVVRLNRPNSAPHSALHAHSRIQDMAWDPEREEIDQFIIDSADAVINLAGAGIGDKRWTPAYKDTILRSRLAATSTLATAIAHSTTPPRAFLSASATGFYGFPDQAVDESSKRGSTFLSGVCEQWENAAKPALLSDTRVAFLRTGLVMSPQGGALGRLLPLLKVGLGGPLGSGKQVWSWITLEDHIRAVLHVLDNKEAWGPVNLVAPGATSNAEVTTALAAALNRPAKFRVPAFALKLAVGEFSQEIVRGVLVRPSLLESLNFEFNHPDTAQMARWIAARLQSF